MFQTGSTVVYGSQGLFQITSVSKMEIAGETRSYYVLSPVFSSGSTVFVPTENHELVSRIRLPFNEETVRRALNTEPNEPCLWIEDDNLRKKTYKEILSKGDLIKTAMLVKTLTRHKCELNAAGKRFRQNDERLLNDAQKPLIEEIKYAFQVGEPEAEQILEQACHE